jgi:methyl-accepting chemotaxis protein
LINDRGDELLDSTLKQTAAIEQLSATTEELNATAEQNSSLTSKAMLSLKDSEQYLDISRNKLEQLSGAIAQIRQSSGEIQNITNVINDISYQTNLLSLNAMIEASRGSDNGGFKVVALEVKKLAERSSDAAANINKLLKANFTAVQEGVDLAEAMQLGFNDIQDNNKPLVSTFQNVSDASEEQRQAIRQIAIGLNEISLTVEQNKQQAEGSANAATELQENAQALQRLVVQLQQSIEQ